MLTPAYNGYGNEDDLYAMGLSLEPLTKEVNQEEYDRWGARARVGVVGVVDVVVVDDVDVAVLALETAPTSQLWERRLPRSQVITQTKLCWQQHSHCRGVWAFVLGQQQHPK